MNNSYTVQRISLLSLSSRRLSSCNRSVSRIDARWFALLRVPLSRDKRSESDGKQSWQYVSDCVSSVYRLLSALVLAGRLQLSICLLTLPAVVCPILAQWNYFYIPAPVSPCRWGQIRRRCVSMCVDARRLHVPMLRCIKHPAEHIRPIGHIRTQSLDWCKISHLTSYHVQNLIIFGSGAKLQNNVTQPQTRLNVGPKGYRHIAYIQEVIYDTWIILIQVDRK